MDQILDILAAGFVLAVIAGLGEVLGARARRKAAQPAPHAHTTRIDPEREPALELDRAA